MLSLEQKILPTSRFSAMLDSSLHAVLEATAKAFQWNEKTLFKLFDQGPEKFLPGTKMPVQRVTDSQELMQLVDYLKTATAPKAGTK